MTTFLREDEARLPKWAQQRLIEARSAAADADDKLAEHLETVEPTRMWYGDYQNMVFIPKHHGHQRVHFTLDDTEPGDSYGEIQVGIKGNGLTIMAGRSILVEHDASNTCTIRMRTA